MTRLPRHYTSLLQLLGVLVVSVIAWQPPVAAQQRVLSKRTIDSLLLASRRTVWFETGAIGGPEFDAPTFAVGVRRDYVGLSFWGVVGVEEHLEGDSINAVLLSRRAQFGVDFVGTTEIDSRFRIIGALGFALKTLDTTFLNDKAMPLAEQPRSGVRVRPIPSYGIGFLWRPPRLHGFLIGLNYHSARKLTIVVGAAISP